MRLRQIGAAVLVCALVLAMGTAAEASTRHKAARHDSQAGSLCVETNSGRTICAGAGQRASAPVRAAVRAVRGVARRLIGYLPHPAGCPRVKFCGCGLARYWHLGSGLNLVATWPKVFPRAHGPAIGRAAVRGDQHHVLGIVGGEPGAWEVVDFNSGGHQSRRYVVASFPGYFFVDPRSRTASR